MQMHTFRSTNPRDSASIAGGGNCGALGRGWVRERVKGKGKVSPKGAEDVSRGGKCCCLTFLLDGQEARERQRPTG